MTKQVFVNILFTKKKASSKRDRLNSNGTLMDVPEAQKTIEWAANLNAKLPPRLARSTLAGCSVQWPSFAFFLIQREA